MKKFFCALIVGVVILAANAADAAKYYPLAEIDAYGFYQNMGYEVDCSHFERVRGKMVFRTILIEDPLSIVKDTPNVLVYGEPRKGNLVEVDMYLVSTADKNLQAAFVAKVINALDAAAFQANKTSIEQSIAQLLNEKSPAEVNINIDEKRHYNLYKEEQRGNVLAIFIEDAAAVEK